MKHKHAELIKQWADGAEIQIKNSFGDWLATDPLWSEHYEYRIKPAEKVVRWLWVVESKPHRMLSGYYLTQEEADGLAKEREIKKYRKLEWSREEFDE